MGPLPFVGLHGQERLVHDAEVRIDPEDGVIGLDLALLGTAGVDDGEFHARPADPCRVCRTVTI